MTVDIRTIGTRLVYENPMDAGSRGHGRAPRWIPRHLWCCRENRLRDHRCFRCRTTSPGAAVPLPGPRQILGATTGLVGAGSGQRSASSARAELREETGIEAAEMVYAGHLFLAYGYSTQGYHVFLAKGLQHGTPEREREEQDLVSHAFEINEVEEMMCRGGVQGRNHPRSIRSAAAQRDALSAAVSQTDSRSISIRFIRRGDRRLTCPQFTLAPRPTAPLIFLSPCRLRSCARTLPCESARAFVAHQRLLPHLFLDDFAQQHPSQRLRRQTLQKRGFTAVVALNVDYAIRRAVGS